MGSRNKINIDKIEEKPGLRNPEVWTPEIEQIWTKLKRNQVPGIQRVGLQKYNKYIYIYTYKIERKPGLRNPEVWTPEIEQISKT